MGPVVRRFGERKALLTGLFCGAAGFAIYGLAPTGHIFWLGVPVMAIWGLAGPSVQGLMTKRVGPTEQGPVTAADAAAVGVMHNAEVKG